MSTFTRASLTSFRAAKFPNSPAPGVAGSGRNWALGAAAYIACWAVQVFVVFVMYEIIYSFVRRWRVSEYRFLVFCVCPLTTQAQNALSCCLSTSRLLRSASPR